MTEQSTSRAPPRNVIALTGGIGSGKSTVAEIFRTLGATIIDADILAREVVEPGAPGLQAVIEQFGQEFLTTEKKLDRARLAALIFADSGARKKLELILHPLIRERFLRKLENFGPSHHAPTIYVVPLFYESENEYPEISKVIVVWAPELICVERLMARNALSHEQALQRIRSQMAPDEKAQKADWTIKNDRDRESLALQVGTAWGFIRNELLNYKSNSVKPDI